MHRTEVDRREFLRRAGLVGFLLTGVGGLWEGVVSRVSSLWGGSARSGPGAYASPPAQASREEGEGLVKVKSCDEFSSEWRKVFGAEQTIQRVRPRESRASLPNPHKGTTTFQRFNGDPLNEGNHWSDKIGPMAFPPPPASLKNDRYPATTISYCRWVWKDIEPEKGRHRWDVIEGALRSAQERGQTLQIRLQPYAGGSGLPDWFWELGGVKQHDSAEPDANHRSYLKHWGELIRAAGARFDGHPNLESFDVAYAGSCGECGGNSTRETAIALVDVYLNAFRKTMLLSMLGTHGCAYAATLDRPLGWRSDCLGDVHEDKRGVIPVPPALQAGATKVDMGLVDPTTNQPEVRFAIEETREDGWHPLTLVEVK